MLKSFKLAGVAICLLALTVSSSWAHDSDEIAKQIAPTGTLRAVINLGNPILAHLNSKSSEPAGLSVDLAQALAQRLQVPLKLISVSSAAKSVESVSSGNADIGFFAIDPVRGQGIAFTSAYVVIEGSYLVRNNSPLKQNEEVDQPKHTVVVGKGSAYDLFLTRELKSAQLIRTNTSPEVVPFFVSENHDIAAGVKQQLEADAKRLGGLRLLPGHFMVIEQAMGLPLGRTQNAKTFLKNFVEDMKSNGFVRDSLIRHNIDGASIP